MSTESPIQTKLSGVQRLLEAGLLVSFLFAMFIMLALFSFDPADPGWSQTGYQTPIRNLGGAVGAYLSDLLLNLFGLIAYSLPFLAAVTGWLLFQKYHRLMQLDYFTLGLKFIGFILFYMAITSIASMNFDDVFYFSAGGIIGDYLSKTVLPSFSFVGSTLLFLTFLFSGFVLLTGFSLIGFIDKTGAYTIRFVQYLLTIPSKVKQYFSDLKAIKLEKSLLIESSQQEESIALPELTQKEPKTFEVDENLEDQQEYENQELHHAFNTINEQEHEDIIAPSKNDSPFEPEEDIEHFVAIDDLIGEPLAFNVQEHVSEEEITAAFETVEPIIVDEPVKLTPQSDSAITQGLPGLDLLDRPDRTKNPIDEKELEQISRLVEEKLLEFGVKAEVVGVYPGPVITRFELNLAPGVKASKVTGLSQDIARSLSAKSVRVVEVIEGKSVIGVELPNKYRETVFFTDVISAPAFAESSSHLAMAIGSDISGKPVIADLAKMPHLLVAGTTGSGKSVAVNTMIVSILYKSSPEDVRMIMIDPKQVELSVYNGIPHLLSEVVTDMKEAANALRWCVGEMERRYKLMSALGVRNLKGYNQKVLEANEAGYPILDPLFKDTDGMKEGPDELGKLPSIVVVIDEFADMMMIVGKKVEELIARIAQKARAAGIHLVLATQRPSVDVITGLIKANIPTRMAFQVSSKIDSRTILDQQGAENLLGMGDMLYLPPGTSVPERVHGAFVDDHEVHAVVNDWKARAKPNYIDEILNGDATEDILLPGEASENADEESDPLYDEAVSFVIETGKVSVSSVQRKLRVGYNRAARLVEQMETSGIVSSPGHNGARDVLVPNGANS